MSVLGLIVEYNPFHNGHLYHLLESKKITNANYSVAIMSGNFLQRGEPAMLDKWSRAKMAIDNGVDLVIELPFVFATSSAEYFASGAIKLLDNLNIIDNVCFGSELGETKLLSEIVDILVNEPDSFKLSLKNNLNLGYSFPKARSLAVIEFFKSNSKDFSNIENIMNSPNNILSIEYMKSLKKIESSIKPFTIKRVSSNYHDKDLAQNISSATSIREDFFKNKTLTNIKTTVPKSTYTYMNLFLDKFNSFNQLEYFSEIFLYLFRLVSYDKISYVNGMDEGIQNRILKAFNSSNDFKNILEEINTKRYTETRIKRILIHSLMNLNKDDFNKLNKVGPRYIRVLGANRNGLNLLNNIKLKSNLPIITKFSNYKKLNDNLLNEMIKFDKLSTDLYFTGLSSFTDKSNMNLDYLTSPYIKK